MSLMLFFLFLLFSASSLKNIDFLSGAEKGDKYVFLISTLERGSKMLAGQPRAMLATKMLVMA